jgi:hypothetical protein
LMTIHGGIRRAATRRCERITDDREG